MTSFSKKVKKELSEINNLKNKTLDWFELLGYSLTNSSKEFTTESKYNINRYARILDNVGVDDYNISVSGKNFTIKTKKKLDEILKEKNPKEYNNIFNNEENIPFLMKYYLVKEIWDNVQENKLKVDMKVRENHPPKPERIVIGEEDGVKIEEVDES